MDKKLHCFLIPLHNEEKVIKNTLQSLTYAGVNWDNVYLVDDGSTDKTLQTVKQVNFPSRNILSIRKNVGKTTALINGFKHFDLAAKYQWVNTLDSDTLLFSDYMEKLVFILNDVSKNTVAIASRVMPLRQTWNLYVSYRSFEYWLTQATYKRSQDRMNCIMVLPGCGTTIRTETFEYLSLTPEPAILTEDMLWTIRIHLEDLGKIKYAHPLRVLTQDPGDLRDYNKQSLRWYKGGFQVYRERSMWKVWKNKINLETSFLFWEGIFFSSVFLFALIAAALRIFPTFVYWFFVFDISIFLLLALIGALYERDIRIVAWLPVFYFLRILKCLIFLWSFISIFVLRLDKHTALKWNQVKRY